MLRQQHCCWLLPGLQEARLAGWVLLPLMLMPDGAAPAGCCRRFASWPQRTAVTGLATAAAALVLVLVLLLVVLLLLWRRQRLAAELHQGHATPGASLPCLARACRSFRRETSLNLPPARALATYILPQALLERLACSMPHPAPPGAAKG